MQSQDTDRAVQQERTHWLAERSKLIAELEEMRRGIAVPVRGVVQSSSGGLASSPPDRINKSPSPVSEDENLELSMVKVSYWKIIILSMYIHCMPEKSACE